MSLVLPPRSQTPIVVASAAHWSHTEKVAAVAVALAELSYPIIFVSSPIFEEYVSSLHANIEFRSLYGRDGAPTPEDIKHLQSLPKGPEKELGALKAFFLNPAADMHTSLQQVFKSFKAEHGNSRPMIFLHDDTFVGGYPVLLGAPGLRPDATVTISLHPLAFESDDTFPFNSGRAPSISPNAKQEHRQAYKDSHADPLAKDLHATWVEKMHEAGVSKPAEEIPSFFHAIGALPDRVLQLGIPEFELQRSDLPSAIQFIGALGKVGGQQGGGEAKLPSWWDEMLEARKNGKKIVAVSQGTASTDHSDLVLPTLKAMKDREDVFVVATLVTKEVDELDGLIVPNNARVEKFVPYGELLKHTDLLVSNGGYGAVQQCLELGIPMVVSGLGQDKPTTNMLVDLTGVGLNLKVDSPGEKAIKEAINKVLMDEGFKIKAQSMSERFKKYNMQEVVDEAIQEVVRGWQS